jgi:glycosyltransferase involved in cell wall biosynthesis
VPVCTIAIPVYNRRGLVQKALRSALAQDLPNLEILVVDNCSTDGTWESLQEVRDPRLRFVRNERNLGLFGNFNRCLALAQGKYLQFLCSDDELTAGCIAREMAIMDAHPEVAMLCTRGELVDTEGRSLRLIAHQFPPGIYPGERAIFSWCWLYTHSRLNAFNYPSGIMMRREAVTQAGFFQERMRTTGDIDYYFRLLERGNLAVVADPGCRITLHEGQAHRTTNMDGTAIREHLEVVRAQRELLQSWGAYRRVMDQMYGLALTLGIARMLRAKTRDSGRLHVEIARRGGVPWHRLVWASIRLVTGRTLWWLLPRVFVRLPQPRPLTIR